MKIKRRAPKPAFFVDADGPPENLLPVYLIQYTKEFISKDTFKHPPLHPLPSRAGRSLSSLSLFAPANPPSAEPGKGKGEGVWLYL